MSTPPQGPYSQAPYPQGSSSRSPYPQGGVPQGAYPQGPYPQSPYPQGPHDPPAQAGGARPQAPLDVVSVVGLVLAVLLAPVGLVVSIVGLVRTSGGRRRGRGFAIAGVVVSVVVSILVAVGVVALVALGSWVSSEVSTGLEDVEDLEDVRELEELEQGFEDLQGLGTGPGLR